MRRFKRLPTMPDRSAFSPAEQEQYDFVVERTQRIHGLESNPANYFKAVLNAPPLAQSIVQFGRLIREGQVRGSYTDAERELVDFVYGEDFDYRGHYAVHLPDAFAVGVRPEAIEALRTRREDELTEDERRIAAHARAVANGAVDEGSYAAIREHFGERGAIEFTIFCAFLVMTLRLWQALGVPDLTDEEVDALFDGLRDGSIEIPDPTARIG
jgi:hypothetical protein